MQARVKTPWFTAQSFPVERIARRFIVLRVNSNTVVRYRRDGGYRVGSTTDSIVAEDLDRLNALAEANGGTWRPSKEEYA